jgi:cobalt-zinc-cadmium efflux system membrane fusion protein
VRIPALGGREWEAKVNYVGSMVDTESRAVPLIAELDNHDHEIKPGMFVWVALPVGESAELLTVPPGAIQTHEGRQFVFVEDSPRTFRRVDVTTGARTVDRVSIDRGLEPGQLVVTDGAFVLKSELLLEREEE